MSVSSILIYLNGITRWSRVSFGRLPKLVWTGVIRPPAEAGM